MNDAPLPWTAAETSQLRRQLLRWFARHARDLPWRRDRDPYRIWVSEVMLQQTQVATVVPYFERFLAAFPTVGALAGATEHDVLRLWEGLGYYRRARDLHRAARLVAGGYAGTLPADADALRSLPGFGRYTANAVLSQAHDHRLPILEANSERVRCRLLGVRTDPKEGATRNRLWDAAERLLPAKQVGHVNQALMELGALVCTPANPRCDACPVRRFCTAFKQGDQNDIPAKAKRANTVLVDEVAVVLRRRGELLLVQRPGAGRWANMWEFPHAEQEPLETHAAAASRLLADLGLHATIRGELTTVRHGVTRFRITMTCLAADWRRGQFRPGAYQAARWVRPEQLSDYPVSTPQRQIAGLLQQP
jgi:A/G-specific adenine glycosylase